MTASGPLNGTPDSRDRIELLTPADAADGLRLSTEAGWNQTAADWDWLLTAGIGFGVRNTAGRVVGTSLALPYPPDFGWVSMVLVHEPYRRRGLATMLLAAAVDHLRALGLVARLDATPAGRAVYAELGFLDIEPISRWRGAAVAGVATPIAFDLAAVAEFDLLAFGADRRGLLQAIAQRPYSRVILGDAGYALIRRGRTATQIGPIVARTADISVHLFQLAGQQVAGAIILDVPARAVELSTGLAAAGFVVDRSFTRMANDQGRSFGESSMIAAIAGPDLG
jgi:GNAT superfamily N-acetyltransferase